LKYDVRLSKRAHRELGSLGSVMREKIVSKLEELGDDPFPEAR